MMKTKNRGGVSRFFLVFDSWTSTLPLSTGTIAETLDMMSTKPTEEDEMTDTKSQRSVKERAADLLRQVKEMPDTGQFSLVLLSYPFLYLLSRPKISEPQNGRASKVDLRIAAIGLHGDDDRLVAKICRMSFSFLDCSL
jgi:hypothetical protein